MTLKGFMPFPLKTNFQPLPSTPNPPKLNRKDRIISLPAPVNLEEDLTVDLGSIQSVKTQHGKNNTHFSTSTNRSSTRSPFTFDATWPKTKTELNRRKASKAAISLRSLILDDTFHSDKPKSYLKTPTTVPRLNAKDLQRLKSQLLKPHSARLVIQQARQLDINPPNALGLDLGDGQPPKRAVCLDVVDSTAETMIHGSTNSGLNVQIKSTQSSKPRLPIILSLLDPTTAKENDSLPFGLMMPPSAMSLHRPLAGALPTPETLKRGFDALLNAEMKVYMYQGPSHTGLYPPTDRLSIYTYWWGFELVMPPPTLEYLSKAKQISSSLLNLLGIIVYAVPGGTRELAPFVGVLSRFIDTEWALLKGQDQGRGIVCGATWFIPAAIVARPWDFEEKVEKVKSG